MKNTHLSLALSALLFGTTLLSAERADNHSKLDPESEISQELPLFDDVNLSITTSNQSSETIANTTADVSVVTAAQIKESGDQTGSDRSTGSQSRSGHHSQQQWRIRPAQQHLRAGTVGRKCSDTARRYAPQ